MKRRWLGWSMSALLLACAGPAQVRETVGSTAAREEAEEAAARKRAMRSQPDSAGQRHAGGSADGAPVRKRTQRSEQDSAAQRRAGGAAAKEMPGAAPTSSARTGQVADAAALEDPEMSQAQADIEAKERAVAVLGIEGNMSEYDVRVTLDGRGQDFDRCHDTHGSRSGKIKFAIRILPSGDVSEVKVRRSSVRDEGLVDCYQEVILASKFPCPHGGYADVHWSTKVGRSRPRADEWFERKVRWDTPAGSSYQSTSSGSTSSSSDRAERHERRRQRRAARRHRSDG